MKPAGLVLSLACMLAAQDKNIAVISHRGEHLRHPENTMAAFAEAERVGADYIEVDVRTTSDGKLALLHDRTVDRTTNGHGEIAKMTFEEVRALRVGGREKVPSFDEVLDYARGKIKVYVDVKSVAARDLVECIRAHGMTGDVVIYSGPISKQIQDLDPRLKIMPEAVSAALAQKTIDELRVKVLAFDANDFKPDVIAVAKKAKALIFVDRLGAADNPAAWEQAVEWGADGIQTDHPEELVRFLRAKGYK